MVAVQDKVLEQLLLCRSEACDPRIFVKTHLGSRVKIFAPCWRAKEGSERPLLQLLRSRRRCHCRRERRRRLSFDVHCLRRVVWAIVVCGVDALKSGRKFIPTACRSLNIEITDIGR